MISKKTLNICLVAVMIVAVIFCFDRTLKNHRSPLFQLKELIAPSKYSKGQMQNLKEDLSTAAELHAHCHRGREYFDAGNYDKAIEEYKKAIEIAQSNSWEWSRVQDQKFPRGRLVEVYMKAGQRQEALYQIDWLLAHQPSDQYEGELLANKYELNGQFEESLKQIEWLLIHGAPSFREEYLTKKAELEAKLKANPEQNKSIKI